MQNFFLQYHQKTKKTNNKKNKPKKKTTPKKPNCIDIIFCEKLKVQTI